MGSENSPATSRRLFPVHTPPGKVGGEDAHSGGDRNLHEGLTYWDLEESRISSRVRQEVMTLVGERNRASMQLGMGGGEAGGGERKKEG